MKDIPRSWGHGMPQIYSYCLFSFFVHRLGGESSGWILAVMSVERSLAISMPLKSVKYRSRKINRILVAAVLIVVGGLYSYGFFTMRVQNGLCYHDLSNIGIWGQFVMNYVILIFTPAALILIANLVIIYCILKAKTQNLTEGQNLNQKEDDSTLDSSTKSMIFMLIAISIAFFMLKTPFHIMVAVVRGSLAFYFATRHEAIIRLLLALSIWAQYLNHGINFYLYILSGSEFRAELVDLFRRIIGKTPLRTKGPVTVTTNFSFSSKEVSNTTV